MGKQVKHLRVINNSMSVAIRQTYLPHHSIYIEANKVYRLKYYKHTHFCNSHELFAILFVPKMLFRNEEKEQTREEKSLALK